MIFNASDLIQSVRLKMDVPETEGSNISNEHIILIANEEITSLYPKIQNINKQIYSSIISYDEGLSYYSLPHSCFGLINEIRMGKLKIPSCEYEILGNQIKFHDIPQDPIDVIYQKRPAKLVALLDPNAKNCGLSVSKVVHKEENQKDHIMVPMIPSEWFAGDEIDFYTQHSFHPQMEGVSIEEIDGRKIFLNTDDIMKGFYACKAGETVIPPVPDEVFPILCQKVAASALAAQGDQDAARIISAGIDEKTSDALNQIALRSFSMPNIEPISW